jgi:heme exporter protein A
VNTLLRFETVCLRRGGRLLVEDLDLALGAGEALHLVGPNGSGKSSLIRLAAGLLRAERGRVTRGSVALADDLPALDRELPLRRALQFWAASCGGLSRLDAALDKLNLSALADVPVRLLSSGQLKRAALARAAASGARLWLLDEPGNALDVESTTRLGSMIAAHRADGGAVLAASHSALDGDWSQLELGA